MTHPMRSLPIVTFPELYSTFPELVATVLILCFSKLLDSVHYHLLTAQLHSTPQQIRSFRHSSSTTRLISITIHFQSLPFHSRTQLHHPTTNHNLTFLLISLTNRVLTSHYYSLTAPFRTELYRSNSVLNLTSHSRSQLHSTIPSRLTSERDFSTSFHYGSMALRICSTRFLTFLSQNHSVLHRIRSIPFGSFPFRLDSLLSHSVTIRYKSTQLFSSTEHLSSPQISPLTESLRFISDTALYCTYPFPYFSSHNLSSSVNTLRFSSYSLQV